jgi:hypothetical protein
MGEGTGVRLRVAASTRYSSDTYSRPVACVIPISQVRLFE